MARVSLEGVSKVYGQQAAVIEVSLAIEEGEFLVLLGPSGCGKTTTLRMIAGLVDATRGVIRIGDVDVTTLPARRRNIGMVFQDYALFPHMTVAENVGFGLCERGQAQASIDRRVDELLSLIRLSGFERRYPDQLSGGQQQRVALARALAFSPSVLLMDEPLGALDLKLRAAMQVELRRVQRALGITTIFVTHDQEEAMSLADRIAVMIDGRIAQIGTPEALYRRPATAFVADFIGKVNFIPGIVKSISNGVGTILLANGGIAQAATRPDCRVGGSVRLALRPETLTLAPAGAASGGLPGTIEQRRFLGNVVHYFVRIVGEQPLLVEQAGTSVVLEVGESVAVTWRAEHALAFVDGDAETAI